MRQRRGQDDVAPAGLDARELAPLLGRERGQRVHQLAQAWRVRTNPWTPRS